MTRAEFFLLCRLCPDMTFGELALRIDNARALDALTRRSA